MTEPGPGPAPPPALLVDLYELTMAQTYFAEGLHERPATFSLFCRGLPAGWGYLLAAGLDGALRYLETLAFQDEDLRFLETTGLFTDGFLAFLGGLRFQGDVRALPEGTAFFPQEPVLELTAPVAAAQLVETVVLNELHLQSLLAAKAARCVDAGRGRVLVDFGLRRAHGGEAGLKAARASYLAGFQATSNVLAGREYGVPVAGTMAHSYIQCFEDELEAFRAFARAYPAGSTLLVDTYDTLEGARRAAQVGAELARRGFRLRGVRLDSGDLAALSRDVRSLLDAAGLPDADIFASGGLDEHEIDRLLSAGAPIDGFGVGTKLVVSADAPALDAAYKLVAFDGRPTLKLSAEKATWPGPKQVWRVRDGEGFAYDVLGCAGEAAPPGGEALLRPMLEGGRRLLTETLETARERAAEQRARLPERCRRLDAEPYEVRVSPALAQLRDRLAAGGGR